jgi:hypothetical protein
MTRSRLALIAFALAATAIAAAPAPTLSKEVHVGVPTIAARAEDVSTLDGIVKAYYEVISGPPDKPREWARDRTLYLPSVRFVDLKEGKDGAISARIASHQEYVDRTDSDLVKNGFDEREIHRETHQYGSIANIFSTYESRRKPNGPVIARGVNSLQLFHDGKRWWVVGATWQDESPKQPIPPQFLPKRGQS